MTTHERELWLVLDSQGQSAIETHVLNLAKGLRDAGQRVFIVFLKDYGPHFLYEAASREDIGVRTITDGKIGFLAALKNVRPWLLHTHGVRAGVLGRLLGRWVGIPVVSTYHLPEHNHSQNRLCTTLDRWTASMGVSIAMNQAIAQTVPNGATVLNDFVHLPPQAQSDASANIAFVGRLSHDRGPDQFVQLASAFPRQDFNVYGDGDMREALERQKPDNVRFSGAHADTPSIWRQTGLLCVSARRDEWPITVLEAMAYGVPVAAFSVGRLPQLINDGVNGFLAKPGDMGALKDRLGRWLAMAVPQRRAMAEQAHNLIRQNYASQNVVPLILDLYQRAPVPVGLAPSLGRGQF